MVMAGTCHCCCHPWALQLQVLLSLLLSVGGVDIGGGEVVVVVVSMLVVGDCGEVVVAVSSLSRQCW